MDRDYNHETDTDGCHHCKGTGRIEHECNLDSPCKAVKDHPLNQSDHSSSRSSQGYMVKQCYCGRVWGIRYQWDAGSGNDDRVHCFGKGDPLKVATERHY